jgi:hypothetical protein
MAGKLPEATGHPDPILSKGKRDYHLGQALLLAGFLTWVVCAAWGILLAGSSGQGPTWFLIDVIGSGGFGLMLAGAVFFTESRAFLRRNKPVRRMRTKQEIEI